MTKDDVIPNQGLNPMLIAWKIFVFREKITSSLRLKNRVHEIVSAVQTQHDSGILE